MICTNCLSQKHDICDDDINPDTGQKRERLYRGCFCQHKVPKKTVSAKPRKKKPKG